MAGNNTFKGADPTHLNACVGDNGHPGPFEYALGYSEAAMVLIDKAIQSREVDIYVYPIAFNMRHSVELWLKHQVSRLDKVRPSLTLDEFNLDRAHDIGNIWSYFKNNSIRVDRRFEVHIRNLNEYIDDVANVDPTGQTFRYPYSNESERHLVSVSVINISTLKNRFNKLKEYLECLDYFMDSLEREYCVGTFTKSLSRVDIENISKIIPAYDKDNKAHFLYVKEVVKKEYCIGSKEFDECMGIINSHYEFIGNSGGHKDLLSCNFEDLITFFESVDLFNSISSYFNKRKSPSDVMTFGTVNVDEAFQSLDDDSYVDAYNYILTFISAEAQYDILILCLMKDNLEYSEWYEKLYFSNEVEINLREENLRYMLGKNNIVEIIFRSLNLLCQTEIINGLADYFSISSELELIGISV